MLRINPDDPRPPFEQLRRQLVEQIELGELAPGAKLPPVRRLAGDLGLAPNTVARTYRELEGAGLVITAGRNGTMVAERATTPATEDAADTLTRSFVAELRRLGLAPVTIRAHVERALADS